MLELPKQEISYWKDTTKPTYDTLTADLEVDVTVIGGGITGLTSAYLLKQAGLRVAVLEKNTIGSGTTGGTTGKVTSQHGLTYYDLSKRLGDKVARIYGVANQEAIKLIRQIILKEKIDCGWEVDDNFVYTTKVDQVDKFKKEAQIAARLGLPSSFEVDLPLPFAVTGAVKFTNQAKINAHSYVLGLASAVNGQGSYVFEHSNVTGIRDSKPCRVKTKEARVTSNDIIVATKVPASPLMARGVYCAMEYPHTSYIVAGRPKKDFNGMYISPDKGHYSILPITAGKERLLLIGGANHIPGLRSARKRYEMLANYAEKQFEISSITYMWKAMDYIAYDSVPLIGKVYPWSKHLYTATAFRKWGLSTSMVAAAILRDSILNQANPWASTFNSLRLSPITSIPRRAIPWLYKPLIL